MSEGVGRRERRKAQTRKALADAALRLFLERGYDQVGVKDVAEAADVAVSTLFAYFPSKEALVFDLDDDLEAEVVAAVRDRDPGQSIPYALREHILRRAIEVAAFPHTAALTRMVESTPALRDYARHMWLRHEAALARALADETGAPQDDITCAAFARFVLEAAHVIHGHPAPEQAATAIFNLLEHGWTTAHPGT
ncbi:MULTISPECIES: helix-turn-helix domain-containing protein [unclassified Nonomuraea]|uniref:TetR/AcrR family transcriptional regulator n=1 Tax=unclassified Nonomuraea TaxID=2593643 RepID=UPI0034077D94